MKGTRKPIDWEAVKGRLAASQLALDRALTVDESRLQDIYRRRAVQLAQRRVHAGASTTGLPWLVVTLGAERYGIALRDVVEAIPFARCTPVPGARSELLGVINVRGEVRSVVDLARLLGLPKTEEKRAGYILLLRRQGQEIGLRVEQLEQVRLLSFEEAAGPPSPYVKGRSEGVLLLDTAALLERMKDEG